MLFSLVLVVFLCLLTSTLVVSWLPVDNVAVPLFSIVVCWKDNKWYGQMVVNMCVREEKPAQWILENDMSRNLDVFGIGSSNIWVAHRAHGWGKIGVLSPENMKEWVMSPPKL